MRRLLGLALILIFIFGLTSFVLANLSGNTIRIASAEKTQEELKEEIRNKLEERRDELVIQTSRIEDEKEELIMAGGFRVIVSPVNDSGKIVKLTIEEKLVGDNIERKIRYISSENKEEEINSSLRLFDYVGEGNISRLRAQLSDGSEEDIEILPEHAREIAIKRLKNNNITVRLEELEHKNIPRAVYNIETNKNGRFIGIFKMNVELSVDVDAQNGQVLRINKPWWAFLVIGEER